MSLKRTPTIIKFSKEEETQKFHNWAVGPSKPSEGIRKARNAMRLAQRNNQLNSQRKVRKVEIQATKISLSNFSSSPTVIRSERKYKLIKKSYIKIKRDGE